jgi:hypothetical protein
MHLPCIQTDAAAKCLCTASSGVLPACWLQTEAGLHDSHSPDALIREVSLIADRTIVRCNPFIVLATHLIISFCILCQAVVSHRVLMHAPYPYLTLEHSEDSVLKHASPQLFPSVDCWIWTRWCVIHPSVHRQPCGQAWQARLNCWVQVTKKK